MGFCAHFSLNYCFIAYFFRVFLILRGYVKQKSRLFVKLLVQIDDL